MAGRVTLGAMLYTGLSLDRACGLRRDPTLLAEALAAPTTRVVPLWQGRCLVDDRPGVAWVTGDAASQLRAQADHEVFLGMDGDTAWLAVDLSSLPGEPDKGPDLGLPGRLESLRAVAAALPAGDAALLAYAKGMLHWHGRHLFCGVCGAPTESRSGGHVRRCTRDSCAAEHFPRTDPAIIVLVHDGDRVLLHRQPHWPPGMWSVLAGFLEPGESLEETTVREVCEETGVRVDSVTYLASQPWPYPSSLMIGFTARYAGGELNIDRHELEDARWFTRAEVLADFGGENKYLPTPGSIARWMMDGWLKAPLPLAGEGGAREAGG